MANLAAPGLGSGLDVNGILTKIMQAESQPLTVLAKKEAAFQAKLSAYGSLKGTISSFQSAVSALNTQSKFKAYNATPSDSTVLTASASSIAAPGSYAITVGQLAQAQTLLTSAKTTTTAAIAATGTSTTLTFQFGAISGGTLTNGVYAGATFTQDAAQATGTVTITDANNSLQGIRDSINAANIGVTASIVNNGNATTPYNLVLTANDTGLASSMKITVGGGADASISSLLAYDPAAAQNLTQSAVAQNATLTANGVAISSASNAVTGAVTGATLNLVKIGSTNLSVTRDTASVSASVQALVKAYNDTTTTLKGFMSYDVTTKRAGILLGDSATQSIQSRIRSTLSAALTGLGSSSLTTLSQIGVSFQKDGTLTLDNTKLQAALTTSFGDMARLFAAVGKPTDNLVTYISSTAASTTALPSLGATVGSNKGTQAVQTGSAAAGLSITTGSNDQFNVAVDGDVAVLVTLTQGLPYASAAALATEVQTQINAALTLAGQSTTVSVAADVSGKMSITSNTFGSTSAVSVTAQGINTGSTDLLGGTPVSSTAATITAAVNDTLALTLDGVSTSVTLAAGTYTASELAGAIQSAINSAPAFSTLGKSVTVSQTLDVLTITSNQPGASSAVSVTGGTAKTNLFGAVPTTSTTVGQVNGTQPGSYALTVTTLATQGDSVGSNMGTQAVQTGSAAANLTITAGGGGNDNFNVAVDGGVAVSVTLTPGAPYASATALATEVQTQINAALTLAGQGAKSVSVAADGSGKISITSNAFGSSSGISVTAGSNTGNTDLLGVAPVSSTVATITAGVNDTLALTLDDVSATVTLAAGSYTATTLLAQIQSAINGTSAFVTAGKTVNVSQAADVFTITSDNYGSNSIVSLTGGTATTNLFGSFTTATTGVDAAGTINGVAALGSGQFLTGVTGDAAEGLKVQIIGGLTGARGTVDYSQGYAYSLNRLLDNFLASAGSIATRTNGINKSITDIAHQREVLNRRLATTEELYRKQFTSLDTLISKMNNTSNSLTSMLASLPTASGR